MRITLNLDDDLTARIERLRAERGLGLVEVVIQVLRRCVANLERQSEPTNGYRTPAVNVGRCLVPHLDDVGAALSVAEGADYLDERAARGSREKFDAVLAKVPDVEPEEHDRLPPSPPR